MRYTRSVASSHWRWQPSCRQAPISNLAEQGVSEVKCRSSDILCSTSALPSSFHAQAHRQPSLAVLSYPHPVSRWLCVSWLPPVRLDFLLESRTSACPVLLHKARASRYFRSCLVDSTALICWIRPPYRHPTHVASAVHSDKEKGDFTFPNAYPLTGASGGAIRRPCDRMPPKFVVLLPCHKRRRSFFLSLAYSDLENRSASPTRSIRNMSSKRYLIP